MRTPEGTFSRQHTPPSTDVLIFVPNNDIATAKCDQSCPTALENAAPWGSGGLLRKKADPKEMHTKNTLMGTTSAVVQHSTG